MRSTARSGCSKSWRYSSSVSGSNGGSANAATHRNGSDRVYPPVAMTKAANALALLAIPIVLAVPAEPTQPESRPIQRGAFAQNVEYVGITDLNGTIQIKVSY